MSLQEECIAMAEQLSILPEIYAGWHNYQALMIKALEPLSGEQLGLRAAPSLRSIDEIARHMVGARARWFHMLLGEGGDTFAELGKWDGPTMRDRSAAELKDGLETTWQGMQEAIARWAPSDWAKTYPGEGPDEPATLTRGWVIWHLIEHDVHHGGEISLMLGMYGLAAPNL